MDAAAQWPQEVGLVKPMEERDSPTCSRPLMEKRLRPQKDHLNCPRCNSTSTKFCYYNNYSLTQPRHFCKTCRRYWTEGGSLRNVPVGGGSRKNKRSSSSSSGSSKKAPDLTPPNGSLSSSQNPKTYQGQDLNLAFQTTQDYSSILESVQLPNIGNNSNNNTAASSPPPSSSLSALELLSGVSSRGLNSFMAMPLAAMPNTIAVNPSGFGLHDLKPTLSFPWYGSIQGVQGSSGRLLFPHEDLKLVPNTGFEQNKGQGDASGYWNGMLGGGSW